MPTLTRWTASDIHELVRLRTAGLEGDEIARILGRTPNACRHKLERLGVGLRGKPIKIRDNGFRDKKACAIKPTEVKMRRCLCCRAEFKSEGRHNHICITCKDRSPYRMGTESCSLGNDGHDGGGRHGRRMGA